MANQNRPGLQPNQQQQSAPNAQESGANQQQPPPAAPAPGLSPSPAQVLAAQNSPAAGTVVSPPPSNPPPDRFVIRKANGQVDRKHPKHGMLTRSGMEQVIREGGVVHHDGQVFHRIEDLPSAADLAEGDSVSEQSTLENLKRQRAELDSQINRLEK